MKKKLLLFAVLFVLLCGLTACKGEVKPLRVCVDLEYRGVSLERSPSVEFSSFLTTVKDLGGPEDIEVEYIPDEGTERETALDRLRTEIMSGGGPDVFIIGCNGGCYWSEEDALFMLPEKNMNAGIFLPLDPYIEKAQFMEWDKLTPVIMEAGRTDEGQMLLPLTYTIPMTMFRKEDVSHTPSKTTSWQDMLADESLVLTASANWMPTFEEREAFENMCGSPYPEYILGDLADYKQEKLLFTEDELLRRITDILDLHERNRNGEFDAVPNFYHWLTGVGFTVNRSADPKYKVIQTGNETLTMIPLYSDDGGYTASVMSFAGINRNTKRPEDAFFLLDVLLRKETQRYSDLYSEWFAYRESIGFPVYMDLMQKSCSAKFQGMTDWYMTEENYAEFCAVRDQISRVRFQGGLEIMLKDVYWKCSDARLQDPNADLSEIVSEGYRAMEQWIQE